MASASFSTLPQAPLSWNLTPAQVAQRAEAIIAQSKKVDDEIGAVTNPTFENTILKYVHNENVLINESSVLGFLHHVSTDKEVRDASTKAEEDIENYSIDAGTREDVYKAIKKVYDDLPSLKSKLDVESVRLVEKLEKKFRRNGLALDKDTRTKVSELRKKLNNICIKFSTQLGEEANFLEFSKEQLEGVPDSVLEQFAKLDNGKYKVTFKYPDYIPLMKYAKRDDTRRVAFFGYENRVMNNNELVSEAVKLRAQIAKLLGYKNHSEFVLEERMAKSPEIVKPFLDNLQEKVAASGRKEVATMLELKTETLQADGLEPHKDFFLWDGAYYRRVYVEREFQLDEEKISEYFPLEQTIEGMLSIFSRLFSLKFVQQPAAASDEGLVWHEDVRRFTVWRTDSDDFVGYLYLDMHPRDNKYGHAANFSLNKRFGTGEDMHYPSTAIVCNFSKPTPTKPSLLKHSEVTTFFHELGHGIHDLVGKAQFARFSGTGVDWDFVEAPSQMLEFWTWNKDQIKELSGHYSDPSKKLDDKMIESLIRTKHVNGAMATLRQLSFGLFDLELHMSPDGEVNVPELWNSYREDILGMSRDGEPMSHGYASFGHIMGGYDSGYYGYLWSEVFACDMYYTKFKKDPLDPKSGAEYRDKVIGRGGSQDQAILLEDFLGRKPNNVAFLQELGIAA